MMPLSPLQLQVAYGMLRNYGVTPNSQTFGAINQYGGFPFVGNIRTVVSTGAQGNTLSNATLLTLETLATDTCPAFADSVPYTAIKPNAMCFSRTLAVTAAKYMGNGDSSKFIQAFNQATTYNSQTNDFILSTQVGNAYISGTFTNMNDLITGGISSITTDPKALGADLANLGKLINLEDLENWGTPLNLVRQLVNLAGVVPPPLQIAFTVVGIEQDIVEDLADPELEVDDQTQRLMFAAMTGIRDSSLKQILKVFRVKTQGFTTMADLLNLQLTLPKSYSTLRIPSVNGFIPVFEGSAITSAAKTLMPGYTLRASDTGYQMTTVDKMAGMTTGEYAYGNKGLAIALLQISGVIDMDLPKLAETLVELELSNQPLVNAMTKPITDDTQAYFKTLVPQGTGPNNTIVLGDLIGTASGYNMRTQFMNTVTSLNRMNTANLANVYGYMVKVVSGAWDSGDHVDIPAGTPATGTYATKDAAINALIPFAKAEMANLTTQYPTEVAQMTTDWRTVGDQVLREIALQPPANITWHEFRANDRSTVMSFCSSVTDYSLDAVTGDTRDFLISVADTATMAGQSLIVTMNQGKNQSVLSSAGINTAIDIK